MLGQPGPDALSMLGSAEGLETVDEHHPSALVEKRLQVLPLDTCLVCDLCEPSLDERVEAADRVVGFLLASLLDHGIHDQSGESQRNRQMVGKRSSDRAGQAGREVVGELAQQPGLAAAGLPGDDQKRVALKPPQEFVGVGGQRVLVGAGRLRPLGQRQRDRQRPALDPSDPGARRSGEQGRAQPSIAPLHVRAIRSVGVTDGGRARIVRNAPGAGGGRTDNLGHGTPTHPA